MNELMRRWEKLGAEIEDKPEYKREGIVTDIAIKIYSLLKEYGMKNSDLAKKLNVSRSYVSQILGGKSNLTIDTLVKLADVFDLELSVQLIPKESIPLYGTEITQTDMLMVAEDEPLYESEKDIEIKYCLPSDFTIKDANESSVIHEKKHKNTFASKYAEEFLI